MSEKIVAASKLPRQARQKLPMAYRKSRAKVFLRPMKSSLRKGLAWRADAIAQQRFPAAVGNPLWRDLDVIEKLKQHRFVIAQKAGRRKAVARRRHQHLQNLAA